MKIAAIASIASFVAAFAAASWYYSAEPDKGRTTASTPSTFDASLPVEDRIAALEQAVNQEQLARQLLQEEVFYLTSELERMTDESDLGRPVDLSDAAPEEASGESQVASSRESRRRGSSMEDRIERLVEAGFLPSQASMIARRESELQMESIEARYEAERSGDMSEFWRNRNSSRDVLREELGDADYERYLEANNRSTSVTVSSVIESSPAQEAGLQAGDQIMRYDGERVFDMTDLTRQAISGAAGQNVVVDIVRDGVPMQIVLPRGPVGISGGRRSR